MEPATTDMTAATPHDLDHDIAGEHPQHPTVNAGPPHPRMIRVRLQA